MSGAGGQSGSAGATDALACANARLQAVVDAGSYYQSIPATCGASLNLCCRNDALVTSCGPAELDFVTPTGGPSPLMIQPPNGTDRETVTLRVRLRTDEAIPLTLSGHNCALTLFTQPGPTPDVLLTFDLLRFSLGGVPKVNVGPVQVTNVTADDFTVDGESACDATVDLGAAAEIVDTLVTSFVNDAICGGCSCAPI
jgi:hypothetical protein